MRHQQLQQLIGEHEPKVVHVLSAKQKAYMFTKEIKRNM